jgi:pyruvate dehydrogenase E1 component alpha subunit
MERQMPGRRTAHDVGLMAACFSGKRRRRPCRCSSASALPQFRLLGNIEATIARRKMAVASGKSAAQAAARRPAAERPAAVPEFTKEQELAAYRQMLLIRRFEEKAGQLYGMGLIGGFCHLYIGQEAVVVGMQMTLKPGDKVITGYRDHGHMLACEMDPKGVMAELTGRRGGYSKGKGGSMHMFSVEKGFYGGHGIVGAQVPLGTGLGFANRYRGNDNVSLTYFGDGAANQGQVYESFNMAKLWKLPVVYVIENNQYGMGTSVARASATTELYNRGASFDIPGERVDGMDVRAVKAAGDKAVKLCREGNGPIILEMITYRYRGHSMSDPAKYRSKEEVDRMRTEHDPIEQVRSRVLKKGLADEDSLKKLDAEVRAIVNEAAEFATNDGEPDPSELWTDVYAG